MVGRPSSTSSVRLDIRRIETLERRDSAVGSRVRVRVVKNKVAPPFKQAEFDIMFGTGISAEGDILDLSVDHGIVQKSGAWYSYADQRLGQGRENVKQFLRDNPDLVSSLRDAVIASLSPEWWRGELPATEADQAGDQTEPGGGKPEPKPAG